MYILQTCGLWTDVALTQDIVFVTANSNDMLSVMLDLNATHGFAQVTGAVVKLCHRMSPDLV